MKAFLRVESLCGVVPTGYRCLDPLTLRKIATGAVCLGLVYQEVLLRRIFS